MKKRMLDALNQHMNAEFYSAYFYLSMAAYFEGEGLPGFANWMQIQFEEEQFHAFKFFKYIAERGGRCQLEAIEAPPEQWKSTTDVFQSTLAHEQGVTERINNLMSLAIEEQDFATVNFLQWFVGEQVEEEASVNTILDQLKLVEGDGRGMLMLDRELAARTFVPPTV